MKAAIDGCYMFAADHKRIGDMKISTLGQQSQIYAICASFKKIDHVTTLFILFMACRSAVFT
jgi:hypothetical protein